ncbi:MAG: DUF6146 family protein [Weeksellaceae bacterium]
MRILFLFLILSFSIQSCSTLPTSQDAQEHKLTLEENKDGEYDIIVFDSDYNYYLNAIAYPIDYYSESYYKNKNTFLVNEWNYRHSQPMRFNPSIYEVSIDYNPQINYGKTLEYKLFNFFRFMEWKHEIDLDRIRN